VEDREQRVGRNEALFREVNERIERISATLQVSDEKLKILCECGVPTCLEQVEVPVGEYERIRTDPTLFMIRPGHEHADLEEVVEETEAYHVVRKLPGGAAEIARELDPRGND
jgi:hypothetical protein